MTILEARPITVDEIQLPEMDSFPELQPNHLPQTFREYCKESLMADIRTGVRKATHLSRFQTSEPKPTGFQKFIIRSSETQIVAKPSRLTYEIWAGSEEYEIFADYLQRLTKEYAVKIYHFFRDGQLTGFGLLFEKPTCKLAD